MFTTTTTSVSTPSVSSTAGAAAYHLRGKKIDFVRMVSYTDAPSVTTTTMSSSAATVSSLTTTTCTVTFTTLSAASSVLPTSPIRSSAIVPHAPPSFTLTADQDDDTLAMLRTQLADEQAKYSQLSRQKEEKELQASIAALRTRNNELSVHLQRQQGSLPSTTLIPSQQQPHVTATTNLPLSSHHFQSSRARTIDDLRNMSSLASQVDQHLTELGVLTTHNVSSSSGTDTEDIAKRSSKHKRKSKTKTKAKKSGKDANLTSNVCFPQLWPHSQLSMHFVSQDKSYDTLTLAEFCAGYATILESKSLPSNEIIHRIAHLKDLMYLATQYKWSNVLNFHAACLLEIERGNLKWGQSFHHLTLSTLANGFLSAVSTSHTSNSFRPQAVLFCSDFQRGHCQFNHDHQGFVRGQKRFVSHICAHCWIQKKVKINHPESSCPHKIPVTSA